MNKNNIQIVNSYLSNISGYQIPNIFIKIDRNSKEEFSKYLSEKLDDKNCRSFEGTDLYLSYKLDGTIKQLNLIDAEICAKATTKRKFEGIVFFENIEELSKCIDNEYIDSFLNLLSNNKKYVTYCFYIDKINNSKITDIKKQITKELIDIGTLDLSNAVSR